MDFHLLAGLLYFFFFPFLCKLLLGNRLDPFPCYAERFIFLAAFLWKGWDEQTHQWRLRALSPLQRLAGRWEHIHRDFIALFYLFYLFYLRSISPVNYLMLPQKAVFATEWIISICITSVRFSWRGLCRHSPDISGDKRTWSFGGWGDLPSVCQIPARM